jgi:hypothetical protein
VVISLSIQQTEEVDYIIMLKLCIKADKFCQPDIRWKNYHAYNKSIVVPKLINLCHTNYNYPIKQECMKNIDNASVN